MRGRVVLVILAIALCSVALSYAQTTAAPASNKQSGDLPLEWDFKDPSVSAPTNPSASNSPLPQPEVPAPPPPSPTTSTPVAPPPPPPPSTSAPTPPGCPTQLGQCPPIPANCARKKTTTYTAGELTCSGCEYCTDAPCTRLYCPTPLDPSCKSVFQNATAEQGSTVECTQCPVCADCPPSPPGGCTPVSSSCVNRGLSTFVASSGRPCPGCEICRDQECPAPVCPPFPADCQVTEQTTVKLDNGLTCPGCPLCKQRPGDLCPPVSNCKPAPPSCAKLIKGTFTLTNGKICPGCDECHDNCPTVACEQTPVSCLSVEHTGIVVKQESSCPGCTTCNITKCPTITSCEPVPSDCAETTIDTFTYGSMVCNGCKRCTRFVCPVQQCTPPVKESCKNVTTPTFTYKNQQCPGCPVCNDVPTCPPLPSCTPIPEDCITVEKRTRNVDGLVCPDCPVCTKRPEKCPPPGDCTPLPAGCKNSTTLSFTYNGLKCPGCQVCNDCPPPSNCKPIKSDCTRVSFESVTVGDKKCQGCAICNDPVCPALSCPVIPDGCTKAIQRWQTINGTKCPDCPDLTPCLPCPQFSCQAPKNCTETKQTTVMVNGKKCPGCPVCVVKCPVKKCAPLPKYCKKSVDTYFHYQHLKCLGCPICKKYGCPTPKCAPLPEHCVKHAPGFFKYHGRKCPGCPVCKKFACDDKCPPVPSECKRTIKVMQHVGDRKCPCLVCGDEPECPKPKCLPFDHSKCARVEKSYFKYKGKRCEGCDKCIRHSCPQIKCPKPGKFKCLRVEKTFFRFHGLTCPGCDKCHKCDKCKCPPKKRVEVEIVKYITKRKYIPYFVYAQPHDHNSTKHLMHVEYLETAKRLRFITILKYRIKQYRTLVIHFRQVLRKLVMGKTITLETYLTTIKILKQMRHDMENKVRLGSIRLETIEKEMKRVRFLLKKLGERSFSPISICKRVGAKRVCGLHPNYFYFNWEVKQDDNAPAPLIRKSYMKHGFWTTFFFTLEPSVVVKIAKIDRKNNIVRFTRRSKRWIRKVIKLSSPVRNQLWEDIITHLYLKNKRAKHMIRKVWGVLKKNNLPQSVRAHLNDANRKSVNIFLKNTLKRKFGRKIYKYIRSQLKTPEVVALIKKHPSISQIKSFPSKETEEMMRLPRSILDLDGNTLVQVLSAKFKFN